ncbi:hypothetical protein [Bradyrhizobium sp.]|uniref:hypothetical protein n=1 Tax=Bradyrhizobium sp. TaxID=376 RepID=UPI003918B887
MVTTMPREPVAGCFSQVKGAMRGAGEFILILFCRTAAAERPVPIILTDPTRRGKSIAVGPN